MRLSPILLYTLMPVLALAGGLLLLFSAAGGAGANRAWMIYLGAMTMVTATALSFTAGWLQRGK